MTLPGLVPGRTLLRPVHLYYNAIPKPEEQPHILKLVAAPGMGKVGHGPGHGVADRRNLLIELQTAQTCVSDHWFTLPLDTLV